MFPIALVAVSSLALAPVAIPAGAPNMLAAAILSDSGTALESIGPVIASAASDAAAVVSDLSVSAVGLLAHTPSLLRTVDTHELARFVALPAATTPLLPSIEHAAGDGASVGTAVAPASVAAVAPFAGVAATDPAADLLTALQSAFGKIQEAFVNAPGNVVMSIGQLLGGDLRTSLRTFTNILIEPLVLIGLVDLPNITAPLAQLAPVLAPVINAIPDIAINVSLGALQLFIDAREGVADTYEGVRTGLSNGDLGAALNSFVTGLNTLAQNGIKDVFGEFGIVSSLVDAGDRLLKAIGQIGAPVATVTTTSAAATTSTSKIDAPEVSTTANSVAADTSSTAASHVGPTAAGHGAAAVVDKDASAATVGTTDGEAAAEPKTEPKTETDAGPSPKSDDKLGADSTPKPGDATKTGTTKTDEAKTGTAKSDDAKTGTTKSDDAKTGTTKSGTSKTGAAESSTGGGSPAEHDNDKKTTSAAAAG